MYLRVCVQVADPLYIHHYQFVPGPLECEVTKGLWSVATLYAVLHKSRVRVILYVLSLQEMRSGLTKQYRKNKYACFV